jgi:uncharacterized membrane protein (DUF2068 family)
MSSPAETPPAPVAPPKSKITGLGVIGLMKIGKGLLLTGLAFGFFSSINSDLGETVRKITFHLRIDPENYFVRLLLEKVAKIDPRTLRTIGLITLLYSTELFIEGIGLWFNQAWAKYLVILATGFFLPVELYSCIHLFKWDRLALLLVNFAVLLYVIRIVWRQKVQAPPAGAVPHEQAQA